MGGLAAWQRMGRAASRLPALPLATNPFALSLSKGHGSNPRLSFRVPRGISDAPRSTNAAPRPNARLAGGGAAHSRGLLDSSLAALDRNDRGKGGGSWFGGFGFGVRRAGRPHPGLPQQTGEGVRRVGFVPSRDSGQALGGFGRMDSRLRGNDGSRRGNDGWLMVRGVRVRCETRRPTPSRPSPADWGRGRRPRPRRDARLARARRWWLAGRLRFLGGLGMTVATARAGASRSAPTPEGIRAGSLPG